MNQNQYFLLVDILAFIEQRGGQYYNEVILNGKVINNIGGGNDNQKTLRAFLTPVIESYLPQYDTPEKAEKLYNGFQDARIL